MQYAMRNNRQIDRVNTCVMHLSLLRECCSGYRLVITSIFSSFFLAYIVFSLCLNILRSQVFLFLFFLLLIPYHNKLKPLSINNQSSNNFVYTMFRVHVGCWTN